MVFSFQVPPPDYLSDTVPAPRLSGEGLLLRISFHTSFCRQMDSPASDSDVLYFELENDAWCCVRPSGTEPKIKFYCGVKGISDRDADEKMEHLLNYLTGELA